VRTAQLYASISGFTDANRSDDEARSHRGAGDCHAHWRQSGLPQSSREEVTIVTTIEKSILIKAPVKQVFSYLDEPEHLPEIWPSMVEIKDVKVLPKGGHRYHWIYKMAGMRFEGETETVEFELDRHLVTKATGQIPATFDYSFKAENGFTRLEVKTEYEIPKTLLGKVAEPFVLKLNEREADTFLANLKDRVET
jgi:uncharacterized membrane protein